MKNYTIEFNGTGEVRGGIFANDTDAISWAKHILEARGCDSDEIVSGDWDADGQNDDGQACEVAPTAYSFMGYIPHTGPLLRETGPEVARALIGDAVDLALLVPA